MPFGAMFNVDVIFQQVGAFPHYFSAAPRFKIFISSFV
jgi:hypothetical protein